MMHIHNIPFEIVQGKIEELGADILVHSVERFEEHVIRQAVKEALEIAQSDGLRYIALSDLGCDNAVFPHIGIAKIMVQEVLDYARRYPQPSLHKVIFCLSNEPVCEVFDRTIRGYVHHLQEDLGYGPYVTVDIIIELNGGIVLIERSNPPYGWALPGGFLDYGESLEEAARREAKEETHLTLEDLKQFHTYSKPGRDARFQTISTVFVAKGRGEPRSGDDAKNLKIIPFKDLMNHDFAFDHKDILKEYLNQ